MRKVRLAVLSLSLLIAAAVPMLLVSVPAYAEGGGSPEDPSIVFGLLAAGVAAFPIVRARIKARRAKHD